MGEDSQTHTHTHLNFKEHFWKATHEKLWVRPEFTAVPCIVLAGVIIFHEQFVDGWLMRWIVKFTGQDSASGRDRVKNRSSVLPSPHLYTLVCACPSFRTRQAQIFAHVKNPSCTCP